MRILIIEDEIKLATALKDGLEQSSYAVDVAHDGDTGLAKASGGAHDVIVLDRMLPGSIQGLDIVRELRAQQIHTPVLFLTAKGKTLDRVEGLNAGADDYLVKPFAFAEFLARIQALLRRPTQQSGTSLKYQDLELDPQTFSVTRAGKTIELTSKEFALLEYLMRSPGQTLTKESIIEHVWNFDADVLPNTVEVFLASLRKKIDKPFKGPDLIKTRRGFGYVFGSNNV